MTLVDPHLWTAGDDATSGFLQTLTDSITQMQGGTPTAGALDFAVVFQTVTQSLTNNTWTAITYDSETDGIDAANGHSTTVNTSRYTAVHTGWYHVDAGVAFAASATGVRAIRFAINGVAVRGRQVQTVAVSSAIDVGLSRKLYLVAGSYVQVEGFQTSGAALSTAVSGTDQGSYLDVEWRHR